MHNLLNTNRSWKTWRPPVLADDTTALNLKPGGAVATTPARIIVPSGTAIAIRAFGKDTDDDTATLEIVGRMDEQSKSGDGIGQSLWQGTVRLGSKTFATTIPLKDGRWGTAATWFEVDWDTPGGHNAANAVTIAGSNQALLLLPTYGYHTLEAVITNVGGNSPEMTEFGILWRDVAMGDVFGLVKTL